MKLLTDLLTAIFETAFLNCGYDKTLGKVVVSGRPDLCQFQCNGAFTGAKLYRKSPLSIADDVSALIKPDGMISKIEVMAPGFINITINDGFLIHYA